MWLQLVGDAERKTHLRGSSFHQACTLLAKASLCKLLAKCSFLPTSQHPSAGRLPPFASSMQALVRRESPVRTNA
jgi:hypothetical protein